jgi:predicted CXXCH cytochrome family protein
MRPRDPLRLSLLSICPVAAFVGLIAVSGMQAPQTAPQTDPHQPAAQTPAKTAAFPLSLFAQATKDDYIDEAACKECHEGPHAGFERSPHKPFVSSPKDALDKHGCQSCHGPGGPHVAHLEKPEEIYQYIISYTHIKPMEGSAVCMRCHDDTMTLAHWRRTGHAKANIGCVDCHEIHKDPEKQAKNAHASNAANAVKIPFYVAKRESNKLLKSDEVTLCASCHRKEVWEFRNNFHHPLPEGRIICSDCHEPHPTRDTARKTGALTNANTSLQIRRDGGRTTTGMCITCHAQVAGPFAFEHDPVKGLSGDGCTECHKAHGSHNPKLLNSFSRGLCAQCHSDKLVTHFPGRTCWQTGCHVAVHGSHTDRFLLRR